MHYYYRISDNSYVKPKLPCCTKKYCLDNFVKTFDPQPEELTIIADNCTKQTLDMINSHCRVMTTNLGNAGSFQYALSLALQLPNDEICYFIEDDYIHDYTAKCIIQDAPADYWTLYDHPDKYKVIGETTRVFRTENSHWKHTISTTMTFATRVSVLRRDDSTWTKHTNDSHPNDHEAFVELSKTRTLASSIPGAAWHTDLTESLRSGNLEIDQKCINLIFEDLSSKICNKESFARLTPLILLEQLIN